MTAEKITKEEFENTGSELLPIDIIGVEPSEVLTIVEVIMTYLSNVDASDYVIDDLVGFSLKIFDAKEKAGHKFDDDFDKVRADLKRRTGRS